MGIGPGDLDELEDNQRGDRVAGLYSRQPARRDAQKPGQHRASMLAEEIHADGTDSLCKVRVVSCVLKHGWLLHRNAPVR